MQEGRTGCLVYDYLGQDSCGMGRVPFYDSENECLENSGRVAAYNFNDDKLRAGDGSGGQVGGDHRGLGVGKGDLVVDHALVGVDADIHSAGHNGIGVSGNQLVGAEHLFVDALHIALQGVDQNVGGQFVLGGGDTAGGAGSHVVGQGDGLFADVADHGLVAGGDHTVGQGAGTVIRQQQLRAERPQRQQPPLSAGAADLRR